ncbi:MAG: hypothetical protein ACPGUF_03615, partial [Litorivicinus sp.]
GGVLAIRHPVTGEKTDATITLKGADSATFRNAAMALAEGDDDDVEGRAAKLLAAITVGWSNVEADGKPVKFSPDAAEKMFAQHAWLRMAADTFVSDRANFFGNA